MTLSIIMLLIIKIRVEYRSAVKSVTITNIDNATMTLAIPESRCFGKSEISTCGNSLEAVKSCITLIGATIDGSKATDLRNFDYYPLH